MREPRFTAWELNQRRIAKRRRPTSHSSTREPKSEPKPARVIRSASYGKPGRKTPLPKLRDSGRTEADIVHASGAIVVRNVRVTQRMRARNTGDHSAPSLDDRSYVYETVNGARLGRKSRRRPKPTNTEPVAPLVTGDGSKLDAQAIEHARAVAAS